MSQLPSRDIWNKVSGARITFNLMPSARDQKAKKNDTESTGMYKIKTDENYDLEMQRKVFKMGITLSNSYICVKCHDLQGIRPQLNAAQIFQQLVEILLSSRSYTEVKTEPLKCCHLFPFESKVHPLRACVRFTVDRHRFNI